MVLSGTSLGGVMSQYLRISKQSKSDEKGRYLQIYENNHVHGQGTKSKLVKTLGYEKDIIASGIEDPVAHYKKVIEKQNAKAKKERENKKLERISDDSPEKNLGYFLPRAMLRHLGVERHINFYNLARNCQFNHYDMIEALVCSRILCPGSVIRAAEDVIPSLYEGYQFSKDQIYDEYPFIGEGYESIIQIFNHAVREKFGRKTSKTYFDCTNFYFEIDFERDDKSKGKSKENRHDPIINMALMLDEEQIPLGMKMFPGKNSEKPEMRKMAKDLKSKEEIKGRTIYVADKGLNCAPNIVQILLDKDGYIFSKSIKQTPADEVDSMMSSNTPYIEIYDDEGKLRYKYKEFYGDYQYDVTDAKGKKKRVSLPEKRILTYNPSLATKQKAEISRLVEKAVTLSKHEAKKTEYGESSKYVSFKAVDTKTGEISDETPVIATLNNEKIEKDIRFAGYNLLITSEEKMPATEIYSIYHNLWKIEESFRYMKSFLQARPVYVSRKESIYGHFLICYLAFLVMRLIEIKEFKNTISDTRITDFIRKYRVVLEKKNTINCATLNVVKPFDDALPNLNLTLKYLTDKHIRNLLDFSF